MSVWRSLFDFVRPAPDEPPYRTAPVPYKPGTEKAQWALPPRRETRLARLARRLFPEA